MRLPIVTKEHQIHEDARAHNEQLYAAFLAGQKVDVPVTPDTVHRVQLKQSGDYRRFWLARGFRIRTKRNTEATILAVWLERCAVPVPAQTVRMGRLHALLQRDGASIAELSQ